MFHNVQLMNRSNCVSLPPISIKSTTHWFIAITGLLWVPGTPNTSILFHSFITPGIIGVCNTNQTKVELVEHTPVNIICLRMMQTFYQGGGHLNMEVTGMCLPENKHRRYLVQDFIEKRGHWVWDPKKFGLFFIRYKFCHIRVKIHLFQLKIYKIFVKNLNFLH